jgi:hypothetical protein
MSAQRVKGHRRKDNRAVYQAQKQASDQHNYDT